MIAIFLFYNIATGRQAKLAFSKDFKHCNIITYDGESWVSYDIDGYGIHTRVLDVTDGQKLLRSLRIIKTLTATICVSVKEKHFNPWKPFWVRSCNEFNRHISGVDINFTFNPCHLYKKLLRYDGKRNYEVLSAWRR